ncbi:MAG TPA: YgiQ family radical SAM protein [Ignavibacteriales bacterium]|nr:YgiQ family radical SAM protein [Ignavibacteriales bacterium]HRR18089.1 YgiQ family radical SAM protein [Ignavibacteriales bacterium]
MFIPITRKEVKQLGWNSLDIILISGDAYIDSSFNGTALIGKWLIKHGYKVAIISQPDILKPDDITKFGEPNLFWGISSGCVDSMVANYTPLKKFRNNDDFTPGGINSRRPDRALIAYANLIRRYFKKTKPIVLGGIEASLRRLTHYDYWDNKLRRSILLDAKADILIYGMGEFAVLELANALQNCIDWKNIRGICFSSKEKNPEFIDLPSYNDTLSDKDKFIDMFKIFYDNTDPITANGLQQLYDNGTYVIQNPPQPFPNETQMDEIYSIEYERDLHPALKKYGKVKALDTIIFSVTTHRGCYGECNFCAITVHQGKIISSRSEKSILREIDEIIKHKDFKGIISDLGGPAANMYKIECNKKLSKGSCKERRCLFPTSCKALKINHSHIIKLLERIRENKKIKKVFVASGIRYDMILNDKNNANKYLEDIIKYHTSGQLKIAPEHIEENILNLMGKPEQKSLKYFKELFDKINQKYNLKQYLTYYIIAAHPGCDLKNMNNLKSYMQKNLKHLPEQVQIFTPTPSTYSTLMYYTEKNPWTNEPIYVEKDNAKKQKQKDIITK